MAVGVERQGNGSVPQPLWTGRSPKPTFRNPSSATAECAVVTCRATWQFTVEQSRDWNRDRCLREHAAESRRLAHPEGPRGSVRPPVRKTAAGTLEIQHFDRGLAIQLMSGRAETRKACGVPRYRDVPGRNYISGTNMMWAFGVPGNISHGALGAGWVGRPVDSAVANGM